MKYYFIFFLASLFILLTRSNSSYGQVYTTASINGLVLDEQTVPIAGAIIVATHLPSGTRYSCLSRNDGLFNFAAVRIGGLYTIEVSLIGYNKTMIKDIYVSLGQDFDVNIVLKNSSQELHEVVVSSKKDKTFNSDRTGATDYVDNKKINSFPTLNRSISEVASLSSLGNGSNFMGRNGLYNNLTIDGSVFNNVFGLAPLPGGQTSAQPISLDAVEEMQIAVAPYDVQQSGFTGAGLNVTTRSGANDIKASVYSFYRNQDLISRKVADVSVSNTNFDHRLHGLRIGGPIIHDKLFFFMNIEFERRNDPANTFLAARPDLKGSNVTSVQATDLDFLKQQLMSRYNYDPGDYENYLLKTSNNKLLLRLDWNINTNNKLTFRYNQLSSWKDNTASSGVGNPSFLPFSSTLYRMNSNIYSLVAELNSNLGKSLANNLLVSSTFFRDWRQPASTLFPYTEIAGGNGIRFTSFGTEPYSANNFLHADVYQISDRLTYYKGKHTVVLGGSFEYDQFENGFMPQLKGYYYYSSLPDFLSDLNRTAATPPVAVANFKMLYSAVLGDDAPVAKLNAAQISGYIQDAIRLSNKVKLTIGLRVDLPYYPVRWDSNPLLDNMVFKSASGNDERIDVGKLPPIMPLWSPRLGLNIDLFGDRSTQLRGGTGLFSGKIPFVWLSNQASNNGLLFKNVNENNTTQYPYTNDVSQFIPTAKVLNSFAVNATVDHFKFPQVFRTNIGLDQKLPFGVTASLDAIYTKDFNSVFHRNANISGSYITLPDGRPRYTSNRLNPVVTGAYILDNTDLGYSYFLTAKLNKKFDFGLELDGAYTYSQTKDASSNQGSTASSAFNNNQTSGNPNLPSLGYSQFDQPHKLLLTVGYKIDYLKVLSTSVFLTYTAYQAGRYSYTYAGDLNNDGTGSLNNDLLYVPKDINDINLVPSKSSGSFVDPRTKAQIWDQLNAFIEQDPGLSKYRGQIVPRNSGILPWANKISMRIAQDISFNLSKTKQILQITADIFNLANLLNPNWGVSKAVIRTTPLTFEGMNAANQPIFSFPYLDSTNKVPLSNTFANSTALDSRWQILLGVRYIFD